MTKPDSSEPTPVANSLIRTGEIVREAPAPMVLQLGNPEEARGGFSFGLVWQAFLQRAKLALPLGVVLSAIACVALWYFTEPKYRSHATLRIIDKQPYLAFPTQEQSQQFALTQIELLRGPMIINRAIDSEGLSQLPELREIAGKEDSVLWISQRLKAIRIGLSEIYEVSFITRRPESACKVVEAIVDIYMRFQAGESDSQRKHMLEVLDDELKRYDAKIERARETLREQTKQANGGDGLVLNSQGASGGPPTALSGRFQRMGNLQQKLVNTEVELEFAQARVAALREEAKKTVRVSEAQIDAAIATNPGLIQLKHDLQYKEGLVRVYKPGSAKYTAAQAAVAKTEADIAAKKAELKPQIEKQVEEHVASQRRDALTEAEAHLESEQHTAQLLKTRIDEERGEQHDHGDKSLEVKFAADNLHYVEEVRRRIADRKIHLETEANAPSQVYNIEKAKVPEYPDGPTLIKKLAMVGTVAFFAPLVLLIGWDLAHRRVLEREQLEREFDVRLVSEVAALPVRSVVPRPGSDRAYLLQSHLFEESVNALRTSLAVDERLKDCRVFVVASAVSGEGKTNLSSQLAMSWSHAVEGKTVIVDGDLRAPNIHDLFETSAGPGLAEVLRGECTLDDVLVMDWGDRLFVIPAGHAGATSPSHLFTGPRFKDIVGQLRSRFDKVIFDVPPVLCASETLMIAKEADGVLMCALHDVSRAGQVKQAYDRLVGAGVNVVGAVLNGAPVRKYSYSYRGYTPV